MQSTFPFTDIDPDCTCGPDCESICIGWCGCKACWHPSCDLSEEERADLDEREPTVCPKCGGSPVYESPTCKERKCWIIGGKCLPVTTWTELQKIMGRVG
jgi:hypothetical protein